MADEDDFAWICSECATRRVNDKRCERCGSLRVVLLSVVTEVFGPALKDFEFNITPASWVILRAYAFDPNENRNLMEEYTWYLERAAALGLTAYLAQSEVLRHVQSCMACINDRACDHGRVLREKCQEADRQLSLSTATLELIKEKHNIPEKPGRDTEGDGMG